MPQRIDRQDRQTEFSFAIKKQLGILGVTSTGWTKEVNLVEWNGNPAKLDIRDWDPNHEHMGKGITLHKPEVMMLLEILLRSFGKDLAKHLRSAETALESAMTELEEADADMEAAEDAEQEESQQNTQ